MVLSLIAAIFWNASPVIFTIKVLGFELPVPWYGLMFAISFLLGQQVLFYIFKKDGKSSKDVEALTVYVALAVFIGARLGHFLFYEWQLLLTRPLDWFGTLIMPPYRGLASHGIIIPVLLALYLYTRSRADQPFLWVVDRIAILVALGGIFIRFGNLMNSEIYGKPTDLPWAFVFIRENDPAMLPLVPRHPTQIYESLFCVFLLILTFWLWKTKRHVLANGFITGVFLVLLFTFRFLVEFLKVEQANFEEGMALNMGQILSIPAVIAGIVIIMISRKNQQKSIVKA